MLYIGYLIILSEYQNNPFWKFPFGPFGRALFLGTRHFNGIQGVGGAPEGQQRGRHRPHPFQ